MVAVRAFVVAATAGLVQGAVQAEEPIEDESSMIQVKKKRTLTWSINAFGFGCETNGNSIQRYGYARNQTEAQCKSLCEADERCVGVDIFSETGWCNFFDQVCSVPLTDWHNPNSMLIAERRDAREVTVYGFNRFNNFCVTSEGKDTDQQKSAATDLQTCADECGSDCAGFEWYGSVSGNWDGGHCYHIYELANLEGSSHAPYRDAQCYAKNGRTCTAGDRQGAALFNVGHADTANSEDRCFELCRNTGACAGFDYTIQNVSQACRLFSANENVSADAGQHNRQYCSMGLRRRTWSDAARRWSCWSGYHLNTSAQMGRHDGATDDFSCSAQCAVTPGCFTFDYTSEGLDENGQRADACRLFDQQVVQAHLWTNENNIDSRVICALNR